MLLPFAIFLVMFGVAAATLGLQGNTVRKTRNRRLEALKVRHGAGDVVETQLRRITAAQAGKLETGFSRLMPKPDVLQRRLDRTGRNWTVGHYAMACLAVFTGTFVLLVFKGLPILLALLLGIIAAIALPHMVVSSLAKRRANKFITRFPDAIDLLVRGLRSGLPISETMGVVAAEVPEPVGSEFRSVADKMRIGRTMEGALQDTADRLQTPEFQFFVVSLAIQRETGGNLAETLGNLAEVLRKRMQMKLKIKAMSSESKASAYIIGSLPFIVFALIFYINPDYMGTFFTDQRLVFTAIGGGIWMAIGVFIMAKMIAFEI